MSYSRPYFEYEADPKTGEVEVGIACPECGDPADYCQDHSHWLCYQCHQPLSISFDDNDDAFWECETCDADDDIPVKSMLSQACCQLAN